MSKPIILVDMDNTILDFHGNNEYPVPKHIWGHPFMYRKGFFLDLPAIKPMVAAIKNIIRTGKYDVYICTKPLAESPDSYSEKSEWIIRHLPELFNKIIMVQDKSMVYGDYLIDDDDRNNNFTGEFVKVDTTDYVLTANMLEKRFVEGIK